MGANRQSDVEGFAQAVTDVTDRVTMIVREEIELAKAEVMEKVTKLAKGIAVGAAAGVFGLVGLLYLLNTFAWFLTKVLNNYRAIWVGFAITALILFGLAAGAGYLAWRWIRGGSNPSPKMAIDEAKLVKETLTSSNPEQTV